MIRDVKTISIKEDAIHKLQLMENGGKFSFRPGDAGECEALGLTPMAAVAHSIRGSDQSYAVLINDELVALWGFSIKDVVNGVAQPWLLTTNHIEQHKKFFIRGSKYIVDDLMEKFSKLEILVDIRYFDAQRWLSWLGFACYPQAIRLEHGTFLYMFKEKLKWDR